MDLPGANSHKKAVKPGDKSADKILGSNDFTQSSDKETNLAARNHKRALKALRTLRSRHEKQAQQIDILCNDIVSAHREFSLKLSRLNFAVSFYEALLSANDHDELLDIAVQCIRRDIDEAGAAIFLLEDNGFNVHLADTGLSDTAESHSFQDWFTRRLVDHISRTNRVCSLEQLLRMGLQGPPAVLKTLSAAAVPLGRFGQGLGFIFIYRDAAHPLTGEELSRVAAISNGLRDGLHRFIPAAGHIKAAQS